MTLGIVFEVDVHAPAVPEPSSDSVRLATERGMRVAPCIEGPGAMTPNIHEVGGDRSIYAQLRPVRQTKGQVDCFLPLGRSIHQARDRFFSSHETNCFSGQVFTTSLEVSQARRATDTPKRMVSN